MRISQLLFLLSFVFTIITTSQAQIDKSNYALLWEISGNGLEKSSYLFGTMHVRDKRAAEFPDSVLIALEKVDAYAMEIHPDTMVAFVMELMTNTSKDNVLKDRLSAKAYERLNQAVIKKTGKPIDSLENQDPSFIEHLLMDFDEPEYTKKNGQIVDLYLYKQAWLMGKPIHGLEELKDYDNVADKFFQTFEKDGVSGMEPSSDDKKSNQQYETMLNIYQSGDIYAMEKWLSAQPTDADFEEAMLDTRNYKMVTTIEKLAKQQATFFAVGTAHLPSSKGMLKILEDKGYNVRKVTATFTGYAERFKPMGNGPEWHTTRSDVFGYEVQTASKPYDFGELDLPQNMNMEVKFQMDMLDMNAFFIMNLEIPGGKKKDLSLSEMETIIEAQNKAKERTITSKKEIEHQGIKGGAFKFSEADNKYSLWRIFVREKTVHIFAVFREYDDFTTPSVAKFYDSVRFFEPVQPNINLTEYRSVAGAYSILMPDNMTYKRENRKVPDELGVERPVIMHQYQGLDKKDGIFYMMQYNFLPPGNTVDNEMTLLKNSIENVKAKWGEPLSAPKPIKFDGLNGLNAVFEIKGEKLIIQEIVRGNRLYIMLIGGKIEADDPKVSTFFDSFQLLPEQEVPLTQTLVPEVGAKLAFPTAYPLSKIFTPDESEESPKVDEWEIGGLDTLNGFNYNVNAYAYPQYHEFVDQATFYDLYKNSLAETESLTEIRDTVFRDGKAWYLEYDFENSTGFVSSLIFFDGYTNYELNVYAPTGRNDQKTWAFFNSFEPTASKGPDYLFSDRSEELLTNLQSKDAEVQLAAKKGINNYEVSPKNLPSIYQMLEKTYPFDTLSGASIHELMYQELLYTNDETTLPFLEKLYTEKASDNGTQVAVLETLASLKTKVAYDLYFKLIANFGQKEFVGYPFNSMVAPLRDTLAMTGNYYPQIVALRGNEALRYYTYNLVFNLLQNDKITPQKVAKDRSLFLSDAQVIVDKYNLKNVKDTMPYIDEFYHLDALLIILGELPADVKTQKLLQTILNLPNPKLVSTAIDALLMQDQTVPRAAFETVFDSPYYWKQLLNNAEYEKKLAQVPSDFLTQKATAKAYVINSLESEYNDLTSFDFIDKRVYEDKEGKVNLYLYTFTMEGYEKTYMGVVSQPITAEQIAVYPSFFDYSTEAYSKDNQEAIYEAMLEGWKE